MERSYGPERAAFLIRTNGDPHLIGFPNWHLVTCHVRIVIPVSATETQEIFQLARLKGVPPEVNAMRVRRGRQESYAGRTFYRLRPAGESFRIAFKKVRLARNDDFLHNLTFPL